MATKTEIANPSLLKASAQLSQRIDAIGVGVAAIKRLEAEVETLKNEVKAQALAAYFAENLNSAQPDHTFDINGRTYVAQVNFENNYFLNKERFDQLKAIMTDRHPLFPLLQERPVVNVDVHDLDEEDRVEFYKEIKDICDTYGVAGFVDEKYVVAPEFHDQRHDLIPKVNLAINAIMPIKVAITI